MTLDEAIEHCDEISHKFGARQEGEDHRQLKDWLEELRDRRDADTLGEDCDRICIDCDDCESYDFSDAQMISVHVDGYSFIKVLCYKFDGKRYVRRCKTMIPTRRISRILYFPKEVNNATDKTE